LFEATAEEVMAMTELVAVVKRQLDDRYQPEGYNVGFNDGAAAGQTVFHAHMHVIPRFNGDLPTPAGGVRHAVMGNGYYPSSETLPSARQSPGVARGGSRSIRMAPSSACTPLRRTDRRFPQTALRPGSTSGCCSGDAAERGTASEVFKCRTAY
jgi:hypothetical protein